VASDVIEAWPCDRLPASSDNALSDSSLCKYRAINFTRSFTGFVLVRPLSPERYKVQFTVSKETYDKLQKTLDTFFAPDAFASQTIPAADSTISENLVYATIVGHSRFAVIPAVLLLM
jgi:hypothetical protein